AGKSSRTFETASNVSLSGATLARGKSYRLGGEVLPFRGPEFDSDGEWRITSPFNQDCGPLASFQSLCPGQSPRFGPDNGLRQGTSPRLGLVGRSSNSSLCYRLIRWSASNPANTENEKTLDS